MADADASSAAATGPTATPGIFAVRMPEAQTDGSRAVLATRLKAPGDAVAAHEPIAEVETDKVVVELPAPADGVLAQWCVECGEPLAPGALVALIRTDTAAPADGAEEVGPVPDTADAGPPDVRGPARSARPTATAPTYTAAPPGGVAADPSTRLSPAVKRLLTENALDAARVLQAVAGSGHAGRLTAADVRAYLARGGSVARAGAAAAGATSGPTAAEPRGEDDGTDAATPRRVPLSPMRRAIAEHMTHSLLHTAPHVTSVFECDMTRVLAHQRAHRDAFAARGTRLTLTAYFVVAAAQALRAVPEVNSRLDGDTLELCDSIDIGIATALGREGLVVPVLRGVQSLSLFGIASGIGELTERARARKLGREALEGGTFTVSNHGVGGSLLAAPIVIHQPQSAILGIGRVRKEVTVREIDGEDVLRIAPMCYVTLTIDHRVLDAFTANEFLSRLTTTLEHWRD